MARGTLDERLFGIVRAVAEGSTCDRGKVGAITVREKRILTTGYPGAPPGLPHCDDVGHMIRVVKHTDGTHKEHCVRTVHAEANAIAQAAKEGVILKGAAIYCSMFPCLDCAKLIVAAGLKEVHTEADYQASADSKRLFDAAKIRWSILQHRVVRMY